MFVLRGIRAKVVAYPAPRRCGRQHSRL